MNRKNKLTLTLLLPILLIFLSINLKAQLIVNSAVGVTPQFLVQNTLVGTGVYVTNVTYAGSPNAIVYNNVGSFSTGAIPTSLGLTSGLIMASGGVSGAIGPNSSGSSSIAVAPATPILSDADLAAMVTGATIKDASVLEFDFVPLSDTVKFRYVFGSEEYPEWVGQYNDIFAFYITGLNPSGPPYVKKNIALIPGTSTPISINNVNINSYPQFFITNSQTSLQADGYTTVLTAIARVVPCTQYHLKLAIADNIDQAYDSWVWLEANSFTSTAVSKLIKYSNPNAIPAAIEGCNNAILQFKLPYMRTDTAWVVIDTIYGTAINGVDYPFIHDSIPILPGTMSSSITITPYMDGIAEGTEYIYMKIKTNSCGSDSVCIPIYDYSPLHITTSNDTMVCQTQPPTYSAFLKGHPTGGGIWGYYYSWYPTTDLDSANIASPTVTPTIDINFPTPQYIKYTLTLTDTTGCPGDTSSVMITVNEQPQPSFLSNPNPAEGCAPLNVSFIDQSSPAIKYYHWYLGDGTTDTSAAPTHNYNISGSFGVKLVATTAQGCKDSIYLPNIVNVYTMPTANFVIGPSADLPKSDATFNFQNTSANATASYWTFGDITVPGNTSYLMNPTHTYPPTAAKYPEVDTVWLYVTSDYGCRDSIWKIVTVVDDDLVFPNIITPNGDSKNDNFEVTGLDKGAYPNNKLLIFNRWGKMVYEKENYQLDTERFDGKGLAEGTYFYILKYKTKLREFEHKGSLTILR